MRRLPRVWFGRRPYRSWHGLTTLLPVHIGHDEFGRWCLSSGWPVTGLVIVALWQCGDADCARDRIDAIADWHASDGYRRDLE